MNDAASESSLGERVSHALAWRIESLRHRLDEHMPFFLPVLRELRATTGRGTLDLARELVHAWRGFGVDPRAYAALMLHDIPRDRWREFIVGEDLTHFMNKTLDREDRLLSRDKAAFGDRDLELGLPWLPTLAVIGRREGPPIEGAAVVERGEQLWPLLRELGRDRDLAVKPSCGQRGSGFFRVSRDGEIRDANGEKVTAAALARATIGYTHRLGDFGYVVQPALGPHPDIVELTGSTAVTTVRVVTALKDGRLSVLESFVKIPGPGRLTDNFRDGETGTLIAGFDPTDGRLSESIGLLRRGNRYVLERTDVAPVTGKRTNGAELPCWREAVDIAFRAALAHPRTATMGWDIALAAEGRFILDGNPNWGPGWQPGSKSGMRSVLAALYPDHFR